MSAAIRSKDYAFTTTDSTSLRVILGISDDDSVWEGAISNVVFRADKANTGTVYLGDSLVSSTNYGGYLQKGEGLCIDLNLKFFDAGNLYLVSDGVPGDSIHILWLQ